MLGTIYGLGTALLWSLGNILIKSQVGKLSTIQLLALRSIAGAVIALLFYFLLVDYKQSPILLSVAWLILFLSVLSGYFGADLLFVYALEDLPLSHIFPIQASYPLIATGLAWLIFGDEITLWMLIGSVLVVAGVGLIGKEDMHQAIPVDRYKRTRGLTLTALSAFGWAISAILLRGVLEQYDAITVNAGLGLLTALSFCVITRPVRTVSKIVKQPWAGGAISLAGALGGTGVANLLFVLAIETSSVARATVLASTAPLFTSILAVAILGESVTSRLIVGTLSTVMGIIILVGG
jgi:drug/metabolite transporter (DMT)-like permease